MKVNIPSKNTVSGKKYTITELMYNTNKVKILKHETKTSYEHSIFILMGFRNFIKNCNGYEFINLEDYLFVVNGYMEYLISELKTFKNKFI